MREIAEGIVHWTAKHPNIGQRVSSYLVVPAATLVDPLLPDEGLDGIEQVVRPEHVVLTNRHHIRDIEAIVEAFGCDVHVHEKGTGTFSDLAVTPSTFAFGDEIVPGITALKVGVLTPEETALRIDAGEGALAFADAFINEDGRIGFFPDELLGEDPEAVRRGLRAAAARLLDERFAHLLFAHGEPIVGDGPEALQVVAVPE
jgi:hypothetical protein